MKTKEEMNAQKEEVETVSKKIHELTDEELEQVSGGQSYIVRPVPGNEGLVDPNDPCRDEND